MLIIPGFATDIVGFFLIFPLTRKIILKKFSSQNVKQRTNINNDYIEGEAEDIDEDNDKK